jgi:hypothetical protein
MKTIKNGNSIFTNVALTVDIEEWKAEIPLIVSGSPTSAPPCSPPCARSSRP